MPSSSPHFDFGANWRDFSGNALNATRVAQARSEFLTLFNGIPLADRSFLDLGFGQGLTLLTACALGAKTVGCDINPKCAAILLENMRFYPEISSAPLTITGSILDPTIIERLHKASSESRYDVVHAWGVLHHTGDMYRAIAHAAALVAPGGVLVLAIYNRHWSSRLWLCVKCIYVNSPKWAQRGLVAVSYPIIFAAKWLVTFKNPRLQQRGMEFYYNVVDWVGGYPYEYASITEIRDSVESLGLRMETVIKAEVPTGCNQFVFRSYK